MTKATDRSVTIIIPVCDDMLLYRCLASIDVDCPVIVSANGSPPNFLRAIRRSVEKQPNIEIVSTETRGIGRAYNCAIARAETQWVALMDSDCTFEPGALALLLAARSGADLIKGRVRFQTNGASSRLVAAARQLTEDPLYTGKTSAYSPPLLYRLAVVEHMGGYHFHSGMAWREDREFELRRRAAGIPVRLVPTSVIWHKPLTVSGDLRSVWSYGSGQAVGEHLGTLPRLSVFRELAKIKAVLIRGRQRGLNRPATYSAVRIAVSWFGRASALRRLSRRPVPGHGPERSRCCEVSG